MATAITTNSGHVARALRFYNLPEIFASIAIRDPWTDESNPPSADPTIFNTGRVYNPVYHGSTMSSGNTFATFNTSPFLGGSVGYKVLALSTNTFEVRLLSDNTLVGTSPQAAGANAITNLVQGVNFFVTNTNMTAGDYYTFQADGQTGFKAFDTRYLVVPDSGGSISFRGQTYAIVSPSDAYTRGARFVYIVVNLLYNELPIEPFRQIGIHTGLTRKTGVSGSQFNLLPSEVQDCGVLEIVDNRSPIFRDISQRDILAVIVEC